VEVDSAVRKKMGGRVKARTHADSTKVELYGTVFTIKQHTGGYGFLDTLVTDSLKLRVQGGNAFLDGRQSLMLDGSNPVRHKFKIPYEWAWLLRDELRRMKIPVYPDFCVGCDGGYIELVVNDDACRASYKWWSGAPCGWEGMDEFTCRLLSLFDAMCEWEKELEGATLEVSLVCPVAGLSHVEGVEEVLKGVCVGDKVELCRDAGNKHDANAVAVMVKGEDGGSVRIGYVPRQCNAPIASGMDFGGRYFAAVLSCDWDKPKADIAICSIVERKR